MKIIERLSSFVTNVKFEKIHSEFVGVSDAAEKLKPEEQIIVIINSYRIVCQFSNFYSIIGETHSVEEMEKLMLEFAKFKTKRCSREDGNI